MGIQYESLIPEVRRCMVEEIDLDLANQNLYECPRLTVVGATAWPPLLTEAAAAHDDDWLAMQLRSRRFLVATEQRRARSGGYTTAKVPHTAAETLAEGEFNRYYARGLCALLASTGEQVEVYRGKRVSEPRPESECLIGRRFDPLVMLADLRLHPGFDSALRIPRGPNSGLTIRRV